MAIILSDAVATAHPKPEFQYYRKNTGGITFVDWVDTAEVIANVPGTRRPHKTFRIAGYDYLCESDGTTFIQKGGTSLKGNL